MPYRVVVVNVELGSGRSIAINVTLVEDRLLLLVHDFVRQVRRVFSPTAIPAIPQRLLSSGTSYKGGDDDDALAPDDTLFLSGYYHTASGRCRTATRTGGSW